MWFTAASVFSPVSYLSTVWLSVGIHACARSLAHSHASVMSLRSINQNMLSQYFFILVKGH